MIWDIDLIFGMRVYNHKLQINFEIRSGWMIFGQLTAVGLWNFANYLVFTTMIWDIDLIFGMRVYNHKLQINLETFASLLNIHCGDIRVVPTHLVLNIFIIEIYRSLFFF